MLCFLVQVCNFWVTDPMYWLKHENENTGGVDSVVRSSLERRILLKLLCHATIMDIVFGTKFNIVGMLLAKNMFSYNQIC